MENEYEFDIGDCVRPYGTKSDIHAGTITEYWNEASLGNFYEVFGAKGSQTFREIDLHLIEQDDTDL
jgi:hypothetical protein